MWRVLEIGEKIEYGDERYWPKEMAWSTVTNSCVGSPVVRTDHVVRRKISNNEESENPVTFYTEQTNCPCCKNDIGNFVLLRSMSHHHVACGSCKKHYIVSQNFLAPFDDEQSVTSYKTASQKCFCIKCGRHVHGPSYVLDGDLWCLDCSRSYKITSGM